MSFRKRFPVTAVAVAGAAATLAILGGSALTPAGARPRCDPQWYFANPHVKSRRLHAFDRERDENHTRRPLQATLTAKRGGTLEWGVHSSFGGGGGINFGIVSASVDASFDFEFSRSLTAEIGNEVSQSVAPHHAIVGRYGVFKMVVTGHVYFLTSVCERQQDKGRVAVDLPNQVGWSVHQPHL
jgi:hypothetical protein